MSWFRSLRGSFGKVAQLVERSIVNRMVVGSKPTLTAIHLHFLESVPKVLVFFHVDVPQVVPTLTP